MENFLENLKQFLNWLSEEIGKLAAPAASLFSESQFVSGAYALAIRWILPILAVTVFVRCIWPLMEGRKRQNNVWGYLSMPDGSREPLKHWENSIGRSKLSDIVISLSFVSRSHAVLTFCDGVWSIADLGSKGGVEVNGKRIEKQEQVREGDTISLAGAEMTLLPAESENAGLPAKNRTAAFLYASPFRSGLTLLLILLFQILGGIQICFSMGGDLNPAVPVTFILFILTECLYYLIMRRFSRKYSELELLCYFLCGMDLLIVASAAPGSLYKQFVSIVLGIAAYTVLRVILRDLGRARRLKYALVIGALILLVLNLTVGETRFGAKNWINLGFITFQPLEFVKVAFVIAGAATLDKLLTARNLTAFIGFSGACIGTLALMRDFGTAVIFFGTFLVIAFMRSGDVRTIALISAGAVLGAIAVVSFMPYIASRFEAWGHVWEYANTTGYQQTRTMIAAASGGLLGVGGGNGYLVEIAASDTDLVFGMICEEWGFLIAFITASIIVFFAAFAALLTRSCRSSFYAIAACGAASIFLIQTALNVFGSVDILPLTGVTMPFVSNGGSSMIVSWSLLAFIRSADERLRKDKAPVKTRNGGTI